MGAWLAAVMLARRELRDDLAGRIPVGSDGWRADEFAVTEAACELAVRRYFGDDYDVRSVTSFAAGLRSSWGGTFGLTLVDFEAVIRAALGEDFIDLAGISAGAAGEVHCVAVTRVYQLMEWDEQAVRRVISDAEMVAFRRGWNPALM